jgi:uncharacterized damage-inducible protein DinB
MASSTQPEPWLGRTLRELPAVHRAVLHALQLAEEDLMRCCGELSAEEWNTRPGGVVPVALHVRHIARCIDRLLTYAEGRQLSDAQMVALKSELDTNAVPKEILAEILALFERASLRIRDLASANLEEPRMVGRHELPTTLGGLLVHVAEHTQRHVGQAITTLRVIRTARGA